MTNLAEAQRAAHPRQVLRWAALVALALFASDAQPATSRSTRERPDRALYYQAKAARTRLESRPKLSAQRGEWEKVVVSFRSLVARFPQSAYCDDALLNVGDLYRAMAARFRSERYLTDAVRSYNQLVSEYPSSSLAEQALFAAFEIENTRHRRDRDAVLAAGRRYLENYADSRRAASVRTALRPRKQPEEKEAAPLPTPPKAGLARVFNLRSWSGDSSTRVVLDLERKVTYQQGRLDNPSRLFIDLLGARVHPNLSSRTFPVGDGLLQQVRIAQFNDEIVRVVLDFKAIAQDTVFFRDNPAMLVVDVRAPGTPAPATASLGPPPAAGSSPTPAAPRATPPGSASASTARDPEETPTPAGGPPPKTSASPAVARADPPRATRPPAVQSVAIETPARLPATSLSPSQVEGRAPPATPQPNRSGSFSLSRQFGLSARRIVIDPGHGGHDPGTIGRSGLEEKDLVLDVGLRLERLVRNELRLDVVMTRRTDVFLPLEERTAIANAKEADLFLSIHVNSSRSTSASGVETYYLNFAADPHAEEVAARENAISPATLKDLTSLVKAITQNSKIEESRDFAASVQQALVTRLRPLNTALDDRGVRRAPFYVLLGANMPSILAEIAFVSHPQEENLLKTRTYRERIARSILAGVRRYLEALNRTQTRQLTAGNGQPRVNRAGGR